MTSARDDGAMRSALHRAAVGAAVAGVIETHTRALTNAGSTAEAAAAFTAFESDLVHAADRHDVEVVIDASGVDVVGDAWADTYHYPSCAFAEAWTLRTERISAGVADDTADIDEMLELLDDDDYSER